MITQHESQLILHKKQHEDRMRSLEDHHTQVLLTTKDGLEETVKDLKIRLSNYEIALREAESSRVRIQEEMEARYEVKLRNKEETISKLQASHQSLVTSMKYEHESNLEGII